MVLLSSSISPIKKNQNLNVPWGCLLGIYYKVPSPYPRGRAPGQGPSGSRGPGGLPLSVGFKRDAGKNANSLVE